MVSFLSPLHKHTHGTHSHTRAHLLFVCHDSSALECAAVCSIGRERRREVSSTADEYSWTLPPLATQIPTHRHTVLLRLPDTSLSSHDVYTAFYPWAFLTLDQLRDSVQALSSTSHALSVKEVVYYPKKSFPGTFCTQLLRHVHVEKQNEMFWNTSKNSICSEKREMKPSKEDWKEI